MQHPLHRQPTYRHHQRRLQHPLVGSPFDPPSSPPHRLSLAPHHGGGGDRGCSSARRHRISRRLCLWRLRPSCTCRRTLPVHVRACREPDGGRPPVWLVLWWAVVAGEGPHRRCSARPLPHRRRIHPNHPAAVERSLPAPSAAPVAIAEVGVMATAAVASVARMIVFGGAARSNHRPQHHTARYPASHPGGVQQRQLLSACVSTLGQRKRRLASPVGYRQGGLGDNQLQHAAFYKHPQVARCGRQTRMSETDEDMCGCATDITALSAQATSTGTHSASVGSEGGEA
jgi:hypothetical protein